MYKVPQIHYTVGYSVMKPLKVLVLERDGLI